MSPCLCPVSLAVYNPTSTTFITACGADVKIWDASSGQLVRVHRDITCGPITSLILDDRERKFITGDHVGNIQVFDYVNAACLKVLHKHDREVSCLVYCPTEKAVLSASWDRSLEVTDESNPDKGIAMKTATVGYMVCVVCRTWMVPMNVPCIRRTLTSATSLQWRTPLNCPL
jgi:WD40 repeat protein